VRSAGDRLTLTATDRYRLAVVTLPWSPTGSGSAEVAAGAGRLVDVLVPGAVLAEIARQAGRAGQVTVHADGDRFGLAWSGGTVVTASVGIAFPDRQLDRLLQVRADCVVEVAVDPFAAAVERAVPYAGPHGRVTVGVVDGAIVLRGRDPLAGESEETVKASVTGDHVTRYYQARFLLDALRPFAGGAVRMMIQDGLRATLLAAAGEHGDLGLRYLVVPMRAPDSERS
jgi:DNA polymerase-3 subunit beta